MLFPGRDNHILRYRAQSKWPDNSAEEKQSRVIVEHRPSMTQEHNVFFGTATLFCGEIQENVLCQTEIGIPSYLAL